MNLNRTLGLAFAGALVLGSGASAEDKVLNLYSARHYQTDEALYANFTKTTGIKVNRIEGKEEELFERIVREGKNSPADVFITVDAARLAIADQAGIFGPVKSRTLESRIPREFRDPEGNWFGFSYRARVIVYNKAAVNPQDVQSYEDLAGPKMKGKVCTRSGGHPYQRSLLASLVHHLGEDRSEAWARGVVANFARPPKGGDTDQIKAVAAGECDVALSNSYYVARLMRSTKPEDQAVVEKIAVVWPNQKSYGTHVNISGGGMLKHAPNREAALKFLEYLVSDEAQVYFADGNNEWPVVKAVRVKNPALEALGSFKSDALPADVLAKNSAKAQRIYDRAGYK